MLSLNSPGNKLKVFVPGNTKYVIVEHYKKTSVLYWRGNHAQTRTEQHYIVQLNIHLKQLI